MAILQPDQSLHIHINSTTAPTAFLSAHTVHFYYLFGMHDVIIIGVGGHIRSYLIEYELVWIYGYGYWGTFIFVYTYCFVA